MIDWLLDRFFAILDSGFGIFLAIITVVVLFVGGIVLIAKAVEEHECSVLAHQYHHSTHYTGIFSGGCYVSIGHGQSIPAENLNGFKKAE